MENMEKNTEAIDTYSPKSSFLERLDNFWYHYKWHSIIALFLIFTIVICSFQICSKESYDVHVLYSGNHEINRHGEGGNISEYAATLSSLERAADDFDEDGEIKVTLKDLFMLSAEEIKKIEESDKDNEVNYALINENKQILRDTVMYSSYYVCFFSPSVYEEYKTVDGVEIFAPLNELVENDTSVQYYSESAVYLSSTAFYSLPGISSLPSDTLIALKNPSVFASHFNKKDTERDYERGKATVTKILNYE